MRHLFQKFRRQEDGAIAVETAIVTPILILALLPAVDLGLHIYTMQKMNKATDSGVEYLVNGGRDEAILRNIVQDSFGSYISQQELVVQAWCGCISAGSGDGDGDEVGNEPDGYAGFYVKTATQLAEDMCPAGCDSGSEVTELVNVSLSRDVDGVLRSRYLTAQLQTRVK